MTKNQLKEIAEGISKIATKTTELLEVIKNLPDEEAVKFVDGLTEISSGSKKMMDEAKKFDKIIYG